MARNRTPKSVRARKPAATTKARMAQKKRTSAEPPRQNGSFFSQFASKTAHLAGKPLTFLVSVMAVVVWAASGPFFGYSDTWQLAINTSTTIITFLMVFLIQNTQNRDTLALQLKVSELIFVIRGTENKMAAAEDLSDDELEKLHKEFRSRADHTLTVLENRRKPKSE